MTTCCTYTCNQGRNCPVRGATTKTAERPGSHRPGAHFVDFADTVDPAAPRWHRSTDAAPFALSTPAQLEQMAGPEPIKPAPQWAEASMLLAIGLVCLCAVASVILTIAWSQHTSSAGLPASEHLRAAWAAVLRTLQLVADYWPRLG